MEGGFGGLTFFFSRGGGFGGWGLLGGWGGRCDGVIWLGLVGWANIPRG